MTSMLSVKDWSNFQHYKDRNPPWIKLATNLFQNYDFGKLSDASKLLAICCWTLASRTKEGQIPHDLQYIKEQSCLGNSVTIDNINELINKGYLIVASDLLADCKQSARPETETYRKEVEKEIVDVTRTRSLFELGEILAEVVGWKDDPRWTGNYSRLKAWLDAGWDFDQDILPTVQEVTKKKIGDRPTTLSYFEKPIANAHATRTKPLPKGIPHARTNKRTTATDALFAGFAAIPSKNTVS